MRRKLTLVPGFQQKLDGYQQELAPYVRDLVALRATYRTALNRLRMAGALHNRIGSPLYRERKAIVYNLERQVANTQWEMGRIQRRMVPVRQRIQRIQGEAAIWEREEQRLRAQEAAEIAQLIEARAAAIQAGVANLWSTPKYAFIYRYMQREEGIRAKQKEIEAKEQLVSMLENANVGPEV
ncbi:MAG: hypothetical protein KAX19_13035, partial [Candidatus Brocadiae bacterium]|nr:hypothetical protein [Candidatus Brocadiia bacterium]